MQLSPEGQFISNILGLSLEPNDSHIEVNSLPFWDHINWNRFIPLVTHHGVGGLLFYWIRKLKLENTLPLDVYKGIKHIYESFTNIWEDHREILKRILIRLYESEVEVILIKGAQLAHGDYPDFPLRPIEDIDLLIRKSNRSRVIKFMLEMGFNLYETNQTCDKFFIRKISERCKNKADKPIFIEIHSDLQTPIRLNRSFSIDIDEFWNGTQKRTIDGFSFLQLCPTDNLIYLGAHLSHHHFSRLIWAYDIALHIHRHREEIDWKRLEDICGNMRIRNSLYHSLSLCRELFQIPIPEKVLSSLSHSWLKRKIGQFLIWRHLRDLEKSRVSRFSQFLIRAFLIDSWKEAILWFLFPTREWIKREYSLQNNQEVYPYYLFHPVLYLIKAIRTPMR